MDSGGSGAEERKGVLEKEGRRQRWGSKEGVDSTLGKDERESVRVRLEEQGPQEFEVLK